MEFPEISQDAPAARTEVATAAAGTLDLQKIDLKAAALAQFGNWRAEVAASTKTLTGLVLDLSTPTKLDEAKSLRRRLVGTPLAEARKTSKAIKSRLTAVSADVGAELVKIEADYELVDKLITPQIDARDKEVEEEKRIAAEKEAARKQAHEDRLDILRGYVEQAKGRSAEAIALGILAVDGIEIDRAAWEEFADRAEAAKAEVLAALRELHDATKEREEVQRKAAETAAAAEELAAKMRKLEEDAAALHREREAFEASKRQAAEPKAESLAAEVVQAPVDLVEQVAEVAPVIKTVAVEIVAKEMAPAAGGVVEPIAAAAFAEPARDVRSELNAKLARMSEADLLRVLSFVECYLTDLKAA